MPELCPTCLQEATERLERAAKALEVQRLHSDTTSAKLRSARMQFGETVLHEAIKLMRGEESNLLAPNARPSFRGATTRSTDQQRMLPIGEWHPQPGENKPQRSGDGDCPF